MEIREYKGYKYVVYEDKNIYFYSSLYYNRSYKDLERTIKSNISKLKNEYEELKKYYPNSDSTYYKSKEYANKLVEEYGLNKKFMKELNLK